MARTRAQVAAAQKGDNHEVNDKGDSLEVGDKVACQNRTRRKRTSADTEPHPNPSGKRRRARSPTAQNTVPQTATYNGPRDPISFWVQEHRWPPGFNYLEMEHALARKRSLSSIGRKRSGSASSATPSDQRPREEKSAPYRDSRYETLLATRGAFMVKSARDITTESKTLCTTLLHGEQSVPGDSLFHDDYFEATCRKIHNQNEARVIRDISQLIVPSAECLATRGAEHLENLIDSVNAGWNNSQPLTGTRPQPDYSVGFRREAFSKDQLEKLSPFIGDFIFGDLSLFMSTYYMYFPFLAAEIKCGAAALDVADRQNAHSMTLAARGIVELFRLVKREDEINRQILSFSISHDHRSVRIYGYYPVIDEDDTKYYRHPIHEFSLTALDGKEKWTAYRFTRNVYDLWMPGHFKRICSAIDQLPSEMNFDVPVVSESTGLSQGLEGHHLAPSEADSASLLDESIQPPQATRQIATPESSFKKPTAKKRKGPVNKSQ